MFTHHTPEFLKQQKMRLTLQQKAIMECKSIHFQCSRLHCLSWMWISSTGTTHVLNWLTAHPKCSHLIYLSSCIIDWCFLHNCSFLFKGLKVLVHLCGVVGEFTQEKSRPHRHGIHCQKIHVQQKGFAFHELCSFLTNLLRKVTSRTWINNQNLKNKIIPWNFSLPAAFQEHKQSTIPKCSP